MLHSTANSRTAGSRYARLRFVRLGGALLAGLVAASCGSGGSGGTGDPNMIVKPGALKVIYVSANRRDNWERNAAIEIRFSAMLSKESMKPDVISRAVQIGIVTAKGRVPAKGCLYFPAGKGEFADKDGLLRDRLIFNPTRTKCTSTSLCADNPFGFDPLTTYVITIPSPATSHKFLTSTDGSPIVEEYDTFFTTGEKYVRDIVQPKFTGTDGQGSLSFDPPRKLNGEVPYNARIFLAFDEPLEPSSFEFGNTILVKNETLSALQGTTVLVPGTFQPDACARVWTFIPSFSYGGAGYDIAVTLTSGLTDLAKNPLGNPQTIRFRTEVKAGVVTTQVINEPFDNQAKMDVANTTADWNGTVLGVLQGGSVTTNVVPIQLTATQYPGAVRTRVRDHPFAQTGSGGVGHDQWIYFQAQLGAPAAITQIGWGPSSNALFASFHTEVIVTLGHTQGDSLGTTFANNFDVGTPVKVADDQYIIPQRATIDPPCNSDNPGGSCGALGAVGFWPLPIFTNFFEYNGKNNLIVDVDATLGTNYQITRIMFGPVGFPLTHMFGANGSTAGTFAETVVTDMQFTKKRRTTIGQSLFYDSGVGNPNYDSPIISPATQTGGTSADIEFEGANGILFPIPSNPNNVIPDPTTFTGFVSNVDQLDGRRFIRFRVTFVSNVNTGQVPVIKSIAIPYIF
jgi:hypothetical protein